MEPEQSSDKFDDDMSRLKVEIDLIHSENRRLQEDIRKMKESNKHLELEILGLEERNKELRQSIEASEKELQDLQHKMQLGGGAVESGAEPEVEQRADDIPVFSVFGPPLDGQFEGVTATSCPRDELDTVTPGASLGKGEGEQTEMAPTTKGISSSDVCRGRKVDSSELPVSSAGLEVKPDFEGKLASTVTDQAAQQDVRHSTSADLSPDTSPFATSASQENVSVTSDAVMSDDQYF